MTSPPPKPLRPCIFTLELWASSWWISYDNGSGLLSLGPFHSSEEAREAGRRMGCEELTPPPDSPLLAL